VRARTAQALNPDTGKLRTNQTVRFMHKWGSRVVVAMGWMTSAFGMAHMLEKHDPMVAYGMIGPFFLLAPLLLV
jgi:hypothetical protein